MKTASNRLAMLGLAVLTTCGVMGLTACGGGGVDMPGAAETPASSVISGTATLGPIAGATVTAYGIAGGRMGEMIGSTTSDATGNFTMTLGNHAGGLMLQVKGGTFTDEATGATVALAPGEVMTAAMPGLAAGATASGVQVTPVTAMAQAMAQHMVGGMTDANIAAANAALGRYFSVADILHTQPMNPRLAGAAAGLGPDERHYGMTLAAMSQYAKDQNLANPSAMVSAMMADAADGVLDGQADTSPIPMQTGGMSGGMMGGTMNAGMMASTAGTSGLSMSMATFAGGAANASGMTAADIAALIQKLAASNGRL